MFKNIKKILGKKEVLPTVIGLVGYKQSGKSTCYDFIKAISKKMEVNEIMIAGKLKEVCSEVFHTPLECFEKQELKEVPYEVPVELFTTNIVNIYEAYNFHNNLCAEFYVNNIACHIGKKLITPRKVLQYVGTEILRTAEEEVHCRIAGEKVISDQLNVVTDIRFMNEYNYFLDKVNCKFIPLFVNRKAAENGGDLHASELDIPKIAENCYTLDNNGTLEDLESNLRAYFIYQEIK